MTPEIITVAASAASFGAGLAAEHRAVNQAAQKQARLLEAVGPALHEEDVVATMPRREQLTRWASRNLLAPLALTAALAGGLEAAGWVSNSLHANQPPALEVVVDRSGATALALDGKPVIGQIDGLVTQLHGLQHVTAQAEVASFGGVSQPEPLKDVKATQATGDAPLGEATGIALGRAGLGASKHDAAVVVLTNGNSIGSPKDIASQEAKAHESTPIFIVNVEGAGSSATSDLRAIAQETGGRYWDAHNSSVKTIAQDVQSSLSAGHQEKPVEQPANWTDRIFGGIALLAAAGYYRRRRSYALGKGPKGE
ncbi:MAG TPA: hypothetical protein VK712_02555 [Verrucomicrobiae bacterium]|jgi:hypothetical protein|nr:hypothetical protein [Verrucomicrobiae bacterium]